MQNKFENEVVANQAQVYLLKSYKEKYQSKTEELIEANKTHSDIISKLEQQLENITTDNQYDAYQLDVELQNKIAKLYHIENPPEPYLLKFDNWEDYYRMVHKDIIELRGKIKQEHKEKLIEECKTTILNTVAITFGVDKLLIQDKDGGNVDTIHNVRKEIWATDNEKSKYANRVEYNSSAYHSHENYKDSNNKNKELKEKGQLFESTSGRKINQNEKHDQDHTISAKEISDDPAVILSELYGPDLANMQSNLAAMYPSINRSKKAKTMDEYIEFWHKTKEKRQNEIKDFESRNDLSDSERKKLKSLKDIESFDEDKAREQDKIAREEYNKTLNKEYYLKNPKFAKNLLKTSATQAGWMGLREIFALIFKDVVIDLFDKSKELNRNNIRIFSKTGMIALKEQLKATTGKVFNKWDEILKSSFHVAIRGFLSNIVTTIINILATTLKKWVKVIREGGVSLLSAFKLLTSKSNDMTKEEKYHEASKILIGTVSVTIGVILDEALQLLIQTHFPALSKNVTEMITSTISGIITGLTSVSLVYAIDKIDFFGAISAKELNTIFDSLEKSVDALVVD